MDTHKLPATIFLEGNWTGQGKVLSNNLVYNETSTFKTIKPEPALVVNWQQFTKHAEKGVGLHAENGFLKVLPAWEDGKGFKTELMLSHPFSVNESCSGHFDPESNTITIEASKPEDFQRSASAKGKQVTATKRVYKLNDQGEITYDFYLAVEGGELKHHL